MVVGAVAATAITAALLSRPTAESRKMRRDIHHAVKNLSHAVEDIM